MFLYIFKILDYLIKENIWYILIECLKNNFLEN